MERDLRILTLFKQHYLNQYHKPLKCQYSCWGYYDGMTIKEVGLSNSKLYTRRTKSPISDLWYGLMKQTSELEGMYNKQNIGIFRCVEESQENGSLFWRRHKRMTFSAIAFLQLKNKEDYEKVAKKIENQYADSKSIKQDVQYGALAYCTFDNADLVVLIHGNSIKKLEEMIEETEEFSEVRYCHSIMGVSEEYLKNIKEKLDRGELWNAKDCFGEENISRITMRIMTSGDSDVVNLIKGVLPPFDNVTYYKVSGHESIIVDILDESVKSFLTLLLPGGFATHQNPLYGKQIYNIELSIRREEKDFRRERIKQYLREERIKKYKKPWCVSVIQKYRAQLEDTFKKGEESLYFYYLALIQTLNTLTQYERFNLSNDIFYLLYPSFRLFEKQLKRAINDKSHTEKDELIKESICKYLDSVNSVIYHTVHTDQMFLMVPGYSGTTFAIPIKLCLFYSWFIRGVITLINDSDNRYEYGCLLVPVMESKPQTGAISLGLPHGNRLIEVRLSQRSLYMPRDLMIILTHEIAHYVGENIRNRKKRTENIIKTIAFVLAEGIIPSLPNGGSWVEEAFRKVNKKEIQKYLIQEVSNFIKKSCSQGGYHASIVEGKLIAACEEQLMNEREIFRKIYALPADLECKLREENQDYIRNIKKIQALQYKFDQNRKEILASGVIRKLVPKLLKMYQEVFSDMVALALLEFDVDLYKEAIRISEGMDFEKGSYNLDMQVRENIITYIRGEGKITGVMREDSLERNRLLKELYAYNSSIDLLKEYAEKCYHDIKVYSEQKQQKISEIRETFLMFCGQPDQCSCQEIYKNINEKIRDYNGEVKNDIKNYEEQ